jgi:hypothetical protein
MPNSIAGKCSKCGAPVSGRFCPSCGAGQDSARASGPWILVGGIIALIAAFGLGVLVGKGSGAPALDAAAGQSAPSGGMVAPDISNLSPRERFDRLYDRVMRASSEGDAATLQRFAPMAVQAYGMLDSVDIDAQYDVAVIKLHIGDIDGARLLADSMVRSQPTHLFGSMIRFTIGRFGGDSATARTAAAAFLRNYPAEMRRDRPEYGKHQSAIDTFKRQVEGQR